MNDLVPWLREQIAETRQYAETAAKSGRSPWTAAGTRLLSFANGRSSNVTVVATYDERGVFEQWDRMYIKSDLDGSIAAHIAEHDPRTVLGQCDAHEAVLDLHPLRSDDSGLCNECNDPYPCGTVRALGLAHRHRPGYREEWRP